MPTEGEPGQEEQQMESEQRGGEWREGRKGVGQGREGRAMQRPGTKIKIHGVDEARLV